MNWKQTGMPAALVSSLGQRRELGEFKSVLNDAQNHVMQPVDVESMAQALAESGGREFVEMVRTDAPIREGDIISVRGAGKGKVSGTGGTSRKGRLFVHAEIYK